MSVLILFFAGLTVIGIALAIESEHIARETRRQHERDLDAAFVEAWALIAESRPGWTDDASASPHDQ